MKAPSYSQAPWQYVTIAIFSILILGVTHDLLGQDVQVLQEEGPPKLIEVHVSRSTSLKVAWPIKRVSVSNADIADVQVLSPHQVVILGKAVGQTDMVIWGEEDQVWQARVEVNIDLTALKEQLNELLAGSELQVRQAGDAVVVTGLLRRTEHAAHLRNYMDAAAIRYVDMTSVAGVQQVMIQVRVAEASRTAIRQLGVNFFAGGSDFFGANTIGGSGAPTQSIPIGVAEGSSISSVPFSFVDDLTVSPGVTLFGGIPNADLQVFLQALAENQYLRILAEPRLVALSGEEASFLAGGEFPIPIVQGGTADSTAITIEYREFGVRLLFRPTVLGDNRIHLYVEPEVSDTTLVDAVTLQGFVIPSIVTRRASTTLELNSGQTFALAGLIDSSVDARNARVPGLGDLPILGSLFRSVRYEEGETELVILVTASLVDPLSIASRRPLPGLQHTPPNDWDLYIGGHIENPVMPKLAPIDASQLMDKGLNRLRGPGAWVSYDQKPVPLRPSQNHVQPASTPAPSDATMDASPAEEGNMPDESSVQQHEAGVQ